MKFNLFVTLRGPAGTVEAPNTHNPVEAENLADCLRQLSVTLDEMKGSGMVEFVGVRVEQLLDAS